MPHCKAHASLLKEINTAESADTLKNLLLLYAVSPHIIIRMNHRAHHRQRLIRYLLHCLLCGAYLQTDLMLYAQSERARLDSLTARLHSLSPSTEEHVCCMLALGLAYNPYKPDSAIIMSERATELSEKLGFSFGIAEGLRIAAFGYQRLGRLAETARLYLRALPMFEDMNDSLGIANIFNGLGICYFEQGDYTNALSYYQRAEPIFLRLGDTRRYADVLSNIGYAYLKMNYVDLAKIYSERALSLALTLGNDYQAQSVAMFSMLHLADVYRRKHLLDTAQEYLQRCRRTTHSFSNNYALLSRLHYLWGKIYTDAKLYDKAKLHLDTSLHAAQQANMRFRIKDAYKGLQELFAAEGKFEQAYFYQTNVILYRDSLFNQESARQIAAMQQEIEQRAQNERIALLVKDNQLNILGRNVLIAFALFSLIAGTIIGRFYRRERKNNRQLQHQNNEIMEQQRQLALQSEEIASINAELEQKNAFLTELNAEKDHFLGVAAHDLKNPLTGIRSLSDYIAHADLPRDEIHLLANRISQTADRMFTLVQNLLDINAIENGGFELNICAFDVVPIVENVVQQYMESAIQKNISLRFTVIAAPDESFIIDADEHSMFQVMDNIISNAIKYSPLDKQVFVRVQKNNNAVRIEVQDEGQGLTDEDKQHLFGKFTKLSARPTAGEHSTGLGLSIAKQLIDKMNGRIWCESEYQHGATFVVEFPLVSA